MQRPLTCGIGLGLSVWALAGCGPAPSTGPTVAPTIEVLVPASTPTPEHPPSPTSTSAPTRTATATFAPAPTLTPTPAIQPEAALGGQWVLRRVQMFFPEAGWAMASDVSEQSAAILRTTDGGQSWVRVSPVDLPTSAGAFPGSAWAEFLDGERAWLLSIPSRLCTSLGGDCTSKYADAPSTLWYTSDGGRSWDGRTLPELRMGESIVPLFIDDLHGWIGSEDYAGAGSSWFVVWRTVDGGHNWELLLDDMLAVSNYSLGFNFADADTGLMVFGHDRYLILSPYLRWTHDGGVTWEDLLSPAAPPDDPGLFDLSREGAPYCGTYPGQFLSPQAVLLPVRCDDPNGLSRTPVVSLLYSTSDGGQSWRTYHYPAGALQFLDPQIGWSLGKVIYQTVNGGANWTEMGRVPWQGQFSFVDQSRGWAVGRSDSADGRSYTLYRTDDGGQSWTALTPMLRP